MWKYLRYFLDEKFVVEQIQIAQPPGSAADGRNLLKQAKQLGYCIRQAEEYFRAASEVGLATRPNLLYYGAVCLSRALILLRQDGTHSFDYLRRKRRHNHHGLELNVGRLASINRFANAEALFESLECQCHKVSDPSGMVPWGNFILFCRSLDESMISFPMQIYERDDTDECGDLGETYVNAKKVLKGQDKIAESQLVAGTFSSLELLQILPDMFFDLTDCGIRSELCPGSLKGRIVRRRKREQTGSSRTISLERTYEFFIDGLSEERKARFVEHYHEKNPEIKCIAKLDRNLHFRLTETIDETTPKALRYFPDIAQSISGKCFYPSDLVPALPEPAVYLILLFNLGMVARYYPDLWMHSLDSDAKATNLVQSLLNYAERKFPNLILDQLTLRKHDFRS